jgi:hypothetical protein
MNVEPTSQKQLGVAARETRAQNTLCAAFRGANARNLGCDSTCLGDLSEHARRRSRSGAAMSDFFGPDGTGYSFPVLAATAAAQEDWQAGCMMVLSSGGSCVLPGSANRTIISQLPTLSLLGLVRANCLASP